MASTLTCRENKVASGGVCELSETVCTPLFVTPFFGMLIRWGGPERIHSQLKFDIFRFTSAPWPNSAPRLLLEEAYMSVPLISPEPSFAPERYNPRPSLLRRFNLPTRGRILWTVRTTSLCLLYVYTVCMDSGIYILTSCGRVVLLGRWPQYIAGQRCRPSLVPRQEAYVNTHLSP